MPVIRKLSNSQSTLTKILFLIFNKLKSGLPVGAILDLRVFSNNFYPNKYRPLTQIASRVNKTTEHILT